MPPIDAAALPPEGRVLSELIVGHKQPGAGYPQFFDFRDGKAHLRRRDGKVITVPSGRLSKEDQQYVRSLLAELPQFRHLEVRGLMAMAAFAGDRSSTQADFAHLRELRDRLLKDCPDEVSLHELSMGMSRDYELAILEGATIVRVGTALFEERP